MNAKTAKRIRRIVRRLGFDPRERDVVQTNPVRHVYDHFTGQLDLLGNPVTEGRVFLTHTEVLAPGCGRGIYQRAKRRIAA